MRKHPRSYVRATAALVACGFVVAASAQASATTEPPSSEPAGIQPALPAVIEPAAPTEVERQPLTGVPIDGTFVTYTPRPALIVKIDNVDAEPQAGLNQADVVFEEIVEGRATRFAAVFNSMEANPVGPIRSGRTQDVDLTGSFNDPVFVWSGGNQGVTNALQATGMTLLGEGSPGFFRDNSRPRPHNLFANLSELWAHAGESGNAEPIFEYIAPGTEVDGTPVSSVDMMVGGYDVGWDWDAAQGLFLRSQRGSTHEATDGQISANTIVVILTGYGTSSAGGGPEAVTVGSGQVVVYTAGHKIDGTWTRDRREDPWTLVDATGAPILLTPGRTWVELVDGANYELTDS